MLTPRQVLESLLPLKDTEGYEAIERFLRDSMTRLDSISRPTAKMIEDAWKYRLERALQLGSPPPPVCSQLVKSLAPMPPTTILKMITLEGYTLAGVWFVEETDEPVGFVVEQTSVERNG